ncbi:MAG: hypothetical protein IPK14_19825 [Blastocatellia bacterium]|nr:hypothetical protein [Blastocatellia bacterium]MBL8194365.1 hypothetical protein [Blastocatellia bacterium]MBN8722312.1 hypothetical protein [Acidobacteriota bacterium]
MLNVQKVFLKLIKQSLALAIIFCLSGMASIVCCFTKCQVDLETTCHQTSASFTESNCQESDFEESETCAASEISLETSCSENNSQNCCTTDNTTNNLTSCEFLLSNDLVEGFNSDSSCKMKCCLPSEEVLDIPRIPRLDDLKIIITTELSYPTVVKEQIIFTSFPIKKLVNQEKTYLRCCVFLI